MLKITKHNVAVVQEAIKALIDNKDILVKETGTYPLQIDFADTRYTVNSEKDIANLMNLLQQEVNCFLYPTGQTITVKMLVNVEYKIEAGFPIPIDELASQLQDRVRQVIGPAIPIPAELGSTELVSWHLSSVTEEL